MWQSPNLDLYGQSCPKALSRWLQGLQPPLPLSCLYLSEEPGVPRAPGQSQMMTLLTEPLPALHSVFPSGIRWCLFSPVLQLPAGSGKSKVAGRKLLPYRVEIWVLGQDQGRKKVCQKGEEMKEWLPPTSTPSLNTWRPAGSSQNNPTLRHLPLSCHASYLHFKMGFCLVTQSLRLCLSQMNFLTWTHTFHLAKIFLPLETPEQR